MKAGGCVANKPMKDDEGPPLMQLQYDDIVPQSFVSIIAHVGHAFGWMSVYFYGQVRVEQGHWELKLCS